MPEAVIGLTVMPVNTSVVKVTWYFDEDTQGNYDFFELTSEPGGNSEQCK